MYEATSLTILQVFSIIFHKDASISTHPGIALSPYQRPIAEYPTTVAKNSTFSLIHLGKNYFQCHNFVVVEVQSKILYAMPVATYAGRATTEPDVIADDHAILYKWGYAPILLPGEDGITKSSFAIVTHDPSYDVPPTCRINFGACHSIEYNVKVKDVGFILQNQLAALRGYWNLRFGQMLS
jgi:hypothetical protein